MIRQAPQLWRLRSRPPGGEPRAKRVVEISLPQTQREILDILIRRVLCRKCRRHIVEALHENVLVRRPDVGLVPLLAGLDVAGWNPAGLGIEISRHAVVSARHGIRIVLDVVWRGAGPEGVELADVEEDLLARGSCLPVERDGVFVCGDVHVLRRGGEVIVEVAEEGFVPEDGLDGGAAVCGSFGPGASGAAVAGLVEELRDCQLIAVQDGVEVDGHNVLVVERAQRKVDVVDGVGRVGEPAGSVVVAALGAGGEVCVEICHLSRVERLIRGIDDARSSEIGAVVGGDIVFQKGLWPRLGVLHGILLQRVRLIRNSHTDRPVVDPKVVLPHQQRQSSPQDARIIRMLNVSLHHQRQQRRLRPIQVVQPRPIRNKPKALYKIQEVLNRILGNAHKRPARAQQALDDPVRVPVVRLAKASARDDKGAVHGDEAIRTRGAVCHGGAGVAAREVGPDVDDFGDELADDGVVEFGEKGRVGGEAGSGHFDEFAAGVGEVGGEEGLEGGGVCEGFGEVGEGGEDFGEGSFCWPGVECVSFFFYNVLGLRLAYMSTKVLESEKGCASWMSWRMSPWQYMGESQGAITEPLV